MLLDIDVKRALGGRTISAAIRTDTGITALFGASGTGKTTILNMIAGLVRPDEGHIRIGSATLFDGRRGIDLPPQARGCGYVFQNGRLFPHLRVKANLLYGQHGTSPLSLSAAVDLLGIGALLDRWPSTLSGGEAQRVAIGRALLSGPRILLMDEPLSSLDHDRKAGLLDLILKVRAETGIPILYVSHDRAELAALNAQVIAMEPADRSAGPL